jgi:methionyl-tRNA formyltransferase
MLRVGIVPSSSSAKSRESMAEVVLAGNNLAATRVLDLLLEAFAPDEILVVAPTGASTHEWHVSLEAHARLHTVPVITPSDINAPEICGRLSSEQPRLFMSVYYNQVFGPEIRSLTCPLINFHPSLLPKHRGVAPLVWAIIEGEATTGVTVHHIDEGIDTGSIVLQGSLPIHPFDTGYSLHLKASNLVSALAARVIRDWISTGEIPPGQPQTGSATAHTRRDPQVNHIRWYWPAQRIHDVVRALAPPLPGAHMFLDGQRFTALSAQPVNEPRGDGDPAPGTITLRPSGDVLVWASDRAVCVDAVAADSPSQSRTTLRDIAAAHAGRALE